MESKRKRSENWNEGDKLLLKELIRERVKHIENKNTDTNTNQAKKQAWLEVLESFNHLCTGGQRTVCQLKTQWAATKIVARKQVAEHRKELSKTGGGSQPSEVPISSSDISVWLPNEFIVDSNEFDSDFVVQDLSVEILEEEKTVNAENPVGEEEMQHDGKFENRIKKPSPKLKKEIPTRRNATDDKIKKLAEFDIQCRKELHQLQVEAENKKIRNLEKDYKIMEIKEELNMLLVESEKKRLRNLDKEYDLTEAKLKFYENKSFDIIN